MSLEFFFFFETMTFNSFWYNGKKLFKRKQKFKNLKEIEINRTKEKCTASGSTLTPIEINEQERF